MSTIARPVTHSPDAPILVLAANGKTGRRVADRLEARGRTVRRGSRRATPRFDWDDPATWDAALEGVVAVSIVYVPDLAVPGAPETIERFVRAAERAGVRRLVLLSGRGEPEAQRCEAIVHASPLESTVVRAAWFVQNFTEGDFAPMVASGTIAMPNAAAREPFLDVDDIADVTVAALLEDGHDGETYELTGPRLLTIEALLAEIADAAGRPIAFREVDFDAFAAPLAASGAPAELVDLLRYLFSLWEDGRNAFVTDDVRRAIGRPARDVTEALRTAVAEDAPAFLAAATP